MLDESRLERVEAIFDSVGVLPGFGVRTQPPVTFTPGDVFWPVKVGQVFDNPRLIETKKAEAVFDPVKAG
jgi:hypothetical protein